MSQECTTCEALRAEADAADDLVDAYTRKSLFDAETMRALRQENERLKATMAEAVAEEKRLIAEFRQSREQTAAAEAKLEQQITTCEKHQDDWRGVADRARKRAEAAEREASKLREDLVDAHGLIRSLRSGLKYVTASADHEEAVRWARSSLAHARAVLTQGGGRAGPCTIEVSAEGVTFSGPDVPPETGPPWSCGGIHGGGSGGCGICGAVWGELPAAAAPPCESGKGEP